MTSTAGLGDDTLELINLGLGAAEGTKTLLCELAGTLVLGVAEQLNNAALVWGKASMMLEYYTKLIWADCHLPRNLLDDLANESGALAQVTLGLRWLSAGNADLSLLLVEILLATYAPSPSSWQRH